MMPTRKFHETPRYRRIDLVLDAGNTRIQAVKVLPRTPKVPSSPLRPRAFPIVRGTAGAILTIRATPTNNVAIAQHRIKLSKRKSRILRFCAKGSQSNPEKAARHRSCCHGPYSRVIVGYDRGSQELLKRTGQLAYEASVELWAVETQRRVLLQAI